MSNYIKYNRGLSKSQFKLIVSDGTTDLFAIAHTSGNVDVFMNGVFLIPQITSSNDVTGSNNLPSGSYDYQSGTYDTGTSTFTADTGAQELSTHIQLSITPSSGDVIMIRTY